MRSAWMLACALALAAPLWAEPADEVPSAPARGIMCPTIDPLPVTSPAGPTLCPAPGTLPASWRRTPLSSGDPEPIYYVRFGTGAVFADRTFTGPAIGFGFRGQLDSVAIDLSMNLQAISPSDRNGSGVVAGSLVNLRILRLIKPEAERSAYVGGGMSWGGVDMNGSKYPYDTAHGTGFQAEITGGYEFARQKPVRVFLEGNVVLPLYEAASSTVRYPPNYSVVGIEHGYRYAPSMTVSLGVGWQR